VQIVEVQDGEFVDRARPAASQQEQCGSKKCPAPKEQF